MSNKPKISVIMAAYNAGEYIAQSIESILSQSFKDFELIVINDASTDNTLEIIKKYAQKDNRVVLLNNEENLYATKSRNKGIKISKGEYIAIQDADDISFKNRLDVQIDYLEKNKDVFLLGTGAINVDASGKEINIFRPKQGIKRIKKILEKKNCICHPTVMFRNKGLFYREKIYYSEDYDFYLYLLSSGKKIANISDALVYYRISQNSISREKFVYLRLFAEKSRHFYRQRVGLGKDDYDSFDPNEIFNIKAKDYCADKNILLARIQSDVALNNLKEARKNCLIFFGQYGYFNKALIYYLASFLGNKLISFLKKLV